MRKNESGFDLWITWINLGLGILVQYDTKFRSSFYH